MRFEYKDQLRQRDARPTLEKFKIWLEEKISIVAIKYSIAQATEDTLKHWDGLVGYLADAGFLCIIKMLPCH